MKRSRWVAVRGLGLAFVLLQAACIAPAAQPPLSTIVEIAGTESPDAMPALQALQSDSPGRLADWPWQPPAGDASDIDRDDYLALVGQIPGFAYYVNLYVTGPHLKAPYFFEAAPVFVARWKQTGDPIHLDHLVAGMHRFAAAVDGEIADLGTGTPAPNSYWRSDYPLMYLALLPAAGTAQGDEAMRIFTQAAARRARRWGVDQAPFGGVYNMTLYAAFWLDLAARSHPDLENAAALRAYADGIWDELVVTHDIHEEDSWYTPSDLMTLDAWYRLRGVDWSRDEAAARIFDAYAAQIGNDGTWPGYGHGNHPGDWFGALMLAELVATRRQDPQAKWLAHQAFHAGKDRIAVISAHIGYRSSACLALAWLLADETLVAQSPPAGVTTSLRHWRDLTSGSERRDTGRWFRLGPALASSKTMIRAGEGPDAPYAFLNSGQLGGHSQADAGSVLHYGAASAYRLFGGAVRLDSWNEEANAFLVRAGDTEVPWAGSFASLLTTEDVSVPAQGSTAAGGYARISIREYPGTPATHEAYQALRSMVAATWVAPERAMGYRGWPARLDRSVLLLADGIMLVRDRVEHRLEVPARLGQNWVFGELGKTGTHWLNVWQRAELSAWFGQRKPDGAPVALISSAPEDLLVWFAPRSDATLEIERLSYSRYLGMPEGLVIKDGPLAPTGPLDLRIEHLNTPFRAWYSRRGTWPAGHRQAFTTVMAPHSPLQDAAALAGRISLLQDDADATLVALDLGEARRWIGFRAGDAPLVIENLVTDAEAAMLTFDGDRVSIALWRATHARYEGAVLMQCPSPVDVEMSVDRDSRLMQDGFEDQVFAARRAKTADGDATAPAAMAACATP